MLNSQRRVVLTQTITGFIRLQTQHFFELGTEIQLRVFELISQQTLYGRIVHVTQC